jgi:hypothetical protein
MIDGMAEGWGVYEKVCGDKYIGWVLIMILFSGIKDCNMDMVKNNSMMVQNIWECS